jgi:N-formylglutamate amidohydrolase
MDTPAWSIRRGDGPLVAAAIHHGHSIRAEVVPLLAVDEDTRLREEDPYTGGLACVAPTQIVGLRSRFEFDLNRPPEQAVYLEPADAWGIRVWMSPPPPYVVAGSRALYEAFYREVEAVFAELTRRHARVVVFDLHSYNHRRQGPDGPAADPQENPQINVGSGTIDRGRWGPVLDVFIERMRSFDYPGGKLDVRENVKFRGGHFSRWLHQTFPTSVCAIAVEVKKFFMDEWTGKPCGDHIEAVAAALCRAAEGVLAELETP